MAAIRENIFAAIDGVLSPDVAEYERCPAGDPNKFPARHVHDNGQAQIEREAGTSRYSLSLTVECFVQVDGGAGAHAQLNDLYADTVAKLLPLIGHHGIETIEEGDLRVAVAPLASRRRLGFGLDFTIIFATRRGDPTQI